MGYSVTWVVCDNNKFISCREKNRFSPSVPTEMNDTFSSISDAASPTDSWRLYQTRGVASTPFHYEIAACEAPVWSNSTSIPIFHSWKILKIKIRWISMKMWPKTAPASINLILLGYNTLRSAFPTSTNWPHTEHKWEKHRERISHGFGSSKDFPAKIPPNPGVNI